MSAAPQTEAPAGPEQMPAGAALSHESWTRPTPEQLAAFTDLPTANVADAMHRLGAVDAAIRPAWSGARTLGAAYTVWTRPGDNAGIHEAMRHVQSGDVLVVNGGGDTGRALIGELIGGRAKVLGVTGFVIDGAVRDAAGLAEYDMPVFARAHTAAGPYKDGPYALAAAVAVGGVVVNPGDLVIGDADGVVVVPLPMADRVARLARAKYDDEEAKRQAIDLDLRRAPDGDATS